MVSRRLTVLTFASLALIGANGARAADYTPPPPPPVYVQPPPPPNRAATAGICAAIIGVSSQSDRSLSNDNYSRCDPVQNVVQGLRSDAVRRRRHRLQLATAGCVSMARPNIAPRRNFHALDIATIRGRTASTSTQGNLKSWVFLAQRLSSISAPGTASRRSSAPASACAYNTISNFTTSRPRASAAPASFRTRPANGLRLGAVCRRRLPGHQELQRRAGLPLSQSTATATTNDRSTAAAACDAPFTFKYTCTSHDIMLGLRWTSATAAVAGAAAVRLRAAAGLHPAAALRAAAAEQPRLTGREHPLTNVVKNLG